MMKRILIIIVFYLMGMVTTLMAQAIVIDLSQTVILEGSALNFSVIVHQTETAFFAIDLVDNKGRSLQNHFASPSEGINNYALAVPVDIHEQAWLVIRNGDQTKIQELLILPRTQKLIEQSNASILYNTALTTDQKHKQKENICLYGQSDDWVYLSSKAAVFKGCLLQFDEVKDFVQYPVKVESGQIDQAFIFDARTMKSMKVTQGKNKTSVMLKSTDTGSALFAVNKLTNLPEKLDFTIALPTTQSIFNNLDRDNRKWLANQLLIDEVLTPLSVNDFSDRINPKENTNWQDGLGTDVLDIKPQNYVAFDDMKSFLIEVGRNLRLYSSGEGHGSFVYPINKKASIRQPLYLIDGQVAVIDDLLAMKQDDILSIQIYTDVHALIQSLGPVASAGLIVVKSAKPNAINNNAAVGQAIGPLSSNGYGGPLSPLAFSGSSSQNCYEHNMRLGVFNVNGLSIDRNTLKVHTEQINIIPLSK